jgi:hypothetical protein
MSKRWIRNSRRRKAEVVTGAGVVVIAKVRARAIVGGGAS